MELAYLDPGAGSIIITALVGGIASVGVAFRAFGHRVTGIFRRGKGAGSEEENPEMAAGEGAETGSSADANADGEESEHQVKVES